MDRGLLMLQGRWLENVGIRYSGNVGRSSAIFDDVLKGAAFR